MKFWWKTNWFIVFLFLFLFLFFVFVFFFLVFLFIFSDLTEKKSLTSIAFLNFSQNILKVRIHSSKLKVSTSSQKKSANLTFIWSTKSIISRSSSRSSRDNWKHGKVFENKVMGRSVCIRLVGIHVSYIVLYSFQHFIHIHIYNFILNLTLVNSSCVIHLIYFKTR